MASPTTMETSHALFPDPPRNRRSHTLAEFKVDLGYGDGGVLLENAKVEVKKLYMLSLIQSGESAVTRIYDDPEGYKGNKNVVAYVYGTQASVGNDKWNNWFNIEFADKRFEGSTLHVMGANDEEESDWAIVGGTGNFDRARGTVRRSEGSTVRIQGSNDEILVNQLDLRFFCCMSTKEVVPKPTMSEGFIGSNTDNLYEMKGKSQRLESVEISSEGIFEGIQVSYIDENGEKGTTDNWGVRRPNAWLRTKIKFGPSEFVTEIRGQVRDGRWLVRFEIVTTHDTYGPFGSYDGTTPANFSYKVPDDKTVVGFFAKTPGPGNWITTIGVYTIPKSINVDPR